MELRPHSMTIADACKRYGLGRTKIYELIATNQIEACKFGTRTLVIADSVERFLAALPRLHSA